MIVIDECGFIDDGIDYRGQMVNGGPCITGPVTIP